MTVNGIHYTLCGDYYIPDISLVEAKDRPLGKYGSMRRAYLKEHNTLLYNQLVLSGRLFAHLYEIDDTAHRRMEDFITEAVAIDTAIPDKKTDPMGWVQHMNMIKTQAEEIVFSELIYN